MKSADSASIDGTRIQKASRARYGIVALIFIASTLNNADRAILSITGTAIQQAFGMDALRLGYLFSSFAWAYMLAQIPGGWLMDRFGTRKVYGVSLLLWSAATLLQGAVPLLGPVSAIPGLFALRILVGMAEGPAYPGNSRVVATWFPAGERGTAASIFNASQYAAAVIFMPLMAWVTHNFGWPHVYFMMGGIGIAFGLLWLGIYRAPGEHRGVNAQELALLRDGGALIDLDNKKSRDSRKEERKQTIGALACIRLLLSSRMMLGVYAGQYFITTIVYFFLTWFPIYLVKALHLSIVTAGVLASTLAIAGCVGGIAGGVFSDWLLRRGHSIAFARKLPIVIGMLMASSVALCIWLDAVVAISIVMGIAFFGKGLGSLGWTIVSDTSPKEAAGLSGALFNTCANLAGITTPIVIGYIVQTTGSFNGALVYVGANAVLALLSFLLVVGPIKRITVEPVMPSV